MIRNISRTFRGSPSQCPYPAQVLTPAPTHIAARCRFKTTKSGEEGQFKAVTASQSSHEPSQDKTSKPPHKAARPEVQRQVPTKPTHENVPASEKKNVTKNSS